MHQKSRGFEFVGLAEAMKLPVLGQEGEPVRHDHTRSEVVQQVLGSEGALFAVALQQLVREEGREVGVLKNSVGEP